MNFMFIFSLIDNGIMLYKSKDGSGGELTSPCTLLQPKTPVNRLQKYLLANTTHFVC